MSRGGYNTCLTNDYKRNRLGLDDLRSKSDPSLGLLFHLMEVYPAAKPSDLNDLANQVK
jgi:hypothetical protein